MMPVADAAASAFPRWDVDEKRAKLLLNGVRLDMPARRDGARAGVGSGNGPGPVAAFGPDGRFLALVEEQGGKAKSLAVFG